MVILLANAINSQIVLLNSFMKTHLFMVELGLHFCPWAFSSCCNWLPFVLVPRLLIAVASLVAENRLESIWASTVGAWGSQSTGSAVAGHRLSFSEAPGIFPVQGSNPCLLHRQAGSLPLSHQGSPKTHHFKMCCSVVYSIFTKLYSHHHCFHHPKKNPCIHQQSLPISCSVPGNH